jgi:nucleotide-binding universal stress UspA family protein
MSYKTILVHADGSAQAQQRIGIAAMLAARFDAHLVGAAATGFPSAYFYRATFGQGVLDLSEILQEQRQRAKDHLARFEQLARGSGVRSLESRLIDDETGQGLCLHARYSDLVVLSQFDPASYSSFVRADFPQYVVLHCGRPVLIVPCAGHYPDIGRRVLVAWDASMSATRAVTDAIPLLRRASAVQVVVVEAARHGREGTDGDGEQRGAGVAPYLARHGVKVELVELAAPSHTDIGDTLLNHAAQSGTDLIVMGGYGHARLRELVMGGATRSVLASMTVPVLMSH